MGEVLATQLPRWALPPRSSHTSGCQVPHTVLLQGHRGSGGEAEGWEGTLLALGTFFIFSIYHFTKKKKKKCEFDPQVIPLSTCLFVTAGGFTLPITAWCHSLSRVRIKLSWTWGLLFFAELCIQLFPGFVPPLHYLVQWWMVLHLCWSLMYLRRSSAFSFSVESIRLVRQRSSAKSDIAQVRESLLWSVRH